MLVTLAAGTICITSHLPVVIGGLETDPFNILRKRNRGEYVNEVEVINDWRAVPCKKTPLQVAGVVINTV